MMTREELQNGLLNFYGTESYTRYGLGMLLTDGVRWLCENAECFWLIDIIGSCQNDSRVRSDEMLQDIQFWELNVDLTKRRGMVSLERDKNDVVLTQEIEFTDFPLEEIKLYYSPQERVCCLPSEY